MPSQPKGSEMSHGKIRTKIKFTRTKGRVKNPAKGGNTPSSRSGTKQEAVAAIMQATGWQKHSVRGFLAGVVRKKLGLMLTSQKVAGERLYKVSPAKPSAPKATPAIAASAT